jgi:hypothetical protein
LYLSLSSRAFEEEEEEEEEEGGGGEEERFLDAGSVDAILNPSG